MAAHRNPSPDGPDPALASAADAGPTGAADARAAGAADTESTAIATSIVARIWELRRQAEKRHWQMRPIVGALMALGFVAIANPDLLPGGFTTGLATYGVVIALFLVGVIIAMRRASVRGHTGNVTVPEQPGLPWWRNPALTVPAAFALVFIGRMVGAFDHWLAIFGCAVIVGVAVAVTLPRYETAGHIHGLRLDNPPVLTDGALAAVADGQRVDAGAALADGSLAPDVLELLVLQHHTGERRISWCADLLGTDTADIRDRIARGRRWLELPATEVHSLATANWVRLTADGRRALNYA